MGGWPRKGKVSLERYSRTVDFTGDQTDEERRITNQKHEIDVKNTNCRFHKASKICHFAILYYHCTQLQGLNLILVTSYGEINSEVD